MTEGICPSGWHIPSDGEFTELTDFLGGESVAGGKMKSTYGWNNEGNGSNSSGFNGLPGGERKTSGSFHVTEKNGYWWTLQLVPMKRELSFQETNVFRGFHSYDYGISARCIKD